MNNQAVALVAILLLYPVIAVLVPEPHWFLWWWRTGGDGPVPPDVMERVRNNEGNLLIVKFLILVIASFFSARQLSISVGSLGFRLEQPAGTLFMGIVGAVLLLGWTFAMRTERLKMAKCGVHSQNFLFREPILKIFIILVLGGFAEEFWRALALTTFDKHGISVGYGIFLTSVFFGIGHVTSYRSFGYVLGKMLAPAILGVVLAILFLWSRSLFTPFVIHVLLNSASALMGRRRVVCSAPL